MESRKNILDTMVQHFQTVGSLYNVKDDSKEKKHRKNTVLLIEPRFSIQVLYILANTFSKIGAEKWNYVFFCGASSLDKWTEILPPIVEIRPLDTDNFGDTRLYSDFCKTASLWESLFGEFVLTIQLDCWILSQSIFNIDFFTAKNKSYIGGNMEYDWAAFPLFGFPINKRFMTFNGGLSLRKRRDMLEIIRRFPPEKTLDVRRSVLSEHEDVYFVYGCMKLNLPLGNDAECSHFSVHGIVKNKCFGVHHPETDAVRHFLRKTYPQLITLNQYLKLY